MGFHITQVLMTPILTSLELRLGSEEDMGDSGVDMVEAMVADTVGMEVDTEVAMEATEEGDISDTQHNNTQFICLKYPFPLCLNKITL